MARQSKLMKIVGTLGAVGGFADLLHTGQQERDQDGDDGDDDEQLDQGEPVAPPPLRSRHGDLLDKQSDKGRR